HTPQEAQISPAVDETCPVTGGIFGVGLPHKYGLMPAAANASIRGDSWMIVQSFARLFRSRSKGPATLKGLGRARPRRNWLIVERLEDRLCPSGDLLALSFNTNNILAFDGTTGASHGVFASGGGLQAPTGITLGPDNNVYVSSRDSNDVL